jgi:hypothetical protein
MNKRSSAAARAVAVVALVGGFLLVAVIVATSLGGGGGSDAGGRAGSGHPAGRSRGHSGSISKAYVVQGGDTLTSIAHKTGVPVTRIQALNPGIDPQILITGEKLRLR